MQNNINIKEALNERDGLQIWWRLMRPPTLTASFVPVFIGTMAAFVELNTIHIPLFIAMLLAALLIQAATNMFNEYYDYVRGLDTEQSVGIGGTIVRDGVQPERVLTLGFVFFGIAILLGVYISMASSWWIALIGSVSMLIGYLYTGGPIPIAYTPFGEFFSGFLMGTVMISISYFIQTMHVSVDIILISIPNAIFIGSLLHANNIRDLSGDKESGRKTLAILIGRKNAVRLLGIFFLLSYGLTLIFILMNILPIWSLITFLSAKLAFNAVNSFRGKTNPLDMVPSFKMVGKTNTIYGFLLGFSFLLSQFLSF